MCKEMVALRVKVPSDLSYTGKARWVKKGVDKCITPLVTALQRSGIDMRGSCCGHGKFPGTIQLEDGRLLLIVNAKRY